MMTWSKDFLIKLRTAYEGLNECKVHSEAGPGYKGMMENLWQVAQFPNEKSFEDAIYPDVPGSNVFGPIVDVEISEDEWHRLHNK